MKLKQKLQAAKESITEYAEELSEVKDLNAEEYAAYYGGNYTNFLKAVNTKIFIAMSERDNEESLEDEEKDEIITVEMKINSNKDGILTFDEPKYLGQRETLEQKKIGYLLAKAGMSATIDTENNCIIIENRSVLDKLSETKDSYIEKINEKFANVGDTITGATEMAKEKAANIYEDSKAKAGGVIKRGLKKASEWADNNL